MKKNLLYLFAFVVAAFTVTSCSDDDKPAVPGSSFEAKAYTATDNNFAVTVNGSAMLGKAAQFTPTGDGKATITITGESLDLGSLMTDEEGIPSGLAFPTAGVIPGSPSTTLTVDLVGDADKCAFEGASQSDYCTYSYSGSVTSDNLSINFTDVKLTNQSLAGKWNVPESEGNFYNLFRVNWKSETLVNVFFPMPIETIVSFALGMPLIPTEGDDPVSVATMYEKVLDYVTFTEDGFITARYADTENDFTMADAPKGVAQYVVESDNTIRVFLNPANIIAATVKLAQRSRSMDIAALTEGLMTNLVPMLVNGVPLHYSASIGDSDGNIDETKTAFYLDTETLLPILKTIAPVFQDEEVIKSIVDMASQDPNMASMAGMIEPLLTALPDVINTTSVVEIGVNLQKAE